MLFKLTFMLAVCLPLTDPVENPSADVPDTVQPDAKATDTSASIPQEGLWPSKKLMNLMLARWADQAGYRYELDDEQRSNVREAVAKRWGTFLDENRSTIQPLVNEFVEMRMELEPPGKEQVQEWAKRTMPVFEQVREQLNAGTAEFREILNPRQRAKFELDALRFGVGLQVAQRKLEQWQKGEFESVEFWEPTGPARRHRHMERRHRRAAEAAKVAKTAPEPEETDQIVLELTAWDKYVREFIRIFNLDEGQRTTVLSVLSELKGRAIAHRDRHRLDIAGLEQRIATFTGSDEETAELKKQLTALYGPIDEMFQELKRRIEQIPTVTQRAEAGKQMAKDE